MAFTLLDAKQLLRDYGFSDISSQADRIMAKVANDACMELHRAWKFDFDKRVGSVTVAAPYSTGTVGVSVEGTTVTGNATTFTNEMVLRYIRFNNEPYSYRIASYSSATSIGLAEAYHGDTALSGASYEITQDRIALPDRFRDFEKPILNTGIYRLRPIDINEMMMLRQQSPSTQTPTNYSTEQAEVSGVPTKYLWVWPAPVQKMTIQLIYYVWPTEATANTDTFKVPFEGEGALRDMMIALLKRQQGQPDWQAIFNIARSNFLDLCGTSRLVTEELQREEYWPDDGCCYVRPRFEIPDET